MNTVFWAIVVLGVLIFVHELGHFLLARWAGVRVLVFSLGFGPKLIAWRGRGGEQATEYRISAIPLGGYVKMLGEVDDPDMPILPEQRPFAFNYKSVEKRFAIVAAGPIFNFLFAIVALIVVHLVGVAELLPVIGSVHPGLPAATAGIQAGDRVVAIGGQSIDRWDKLKQRVSAAATGERLRVAVDRADADHAGQRLTRLEFELLPQAQETRNLFGESVSTMVIGITPSGETESVRYGVWDSLVRGVEKTAWMIDVTVTGVWKMITGAIPADQIGGPLMIAELSGKSASHGASNLLFFMAFISVNLGILNLLPVPILDGGHLFFFTVEKIKGAPISDRAQNWANRFGMTVLASLMLFAIYNDIMRLVAGRAE
ncbi:MAG: RIP metalloprotease RseP [Magnetococcales bacterium]|nr:RIP metalloprotease RseP [Magnetococcales bacterium]